MSALPPRVSVIMPVHDAAAFVGSAIASVQGQSFAGWELLAVDDGSHDASAAILARAASNDARIRLLSSGGNLGPWAARNVAMAAARGRYLAFLDADDLWHPEKLARQLAAMERTGAALSCTAYLRHNLDTGRRTVVGVPARASRAELLKTNTIACSTAMLDAARFGRRRMRPLHRSEDFAFWLDLLDEAPTVLGLPQVLATYRQHRDSLSARKGHAAAGTWAVYRGALALPLPAALWYFGHYATRGLLRHRAPALARALGWLHGAQAAG